MVYEFTMTETKKKTIPVQAKDFQAAHKIFYEWYKNHISNPKDTVIYDMLDEGNQGISITHSEGADDAMYSPDDILLPEEKDTPQEPMYDLHVIFESEEKQNVTLDMMKFSEILAYLSIYSIDYYMYPIINENMLKNHDIWIKLIPKKDDNK